MQRPRAVPRISSTMMFHPKFFKGRFIIRFILEQATRNRCDVDLLVVGLGIRLQRRIILEDQIFDPDECASTGGHGNYGDR